VCRQFAFLTLAVLILTAEIFSQRATYTNPVQAGDYPDPSVIRVGRDFYATATSSEWAPEYPILHSRDLVNWQIVGTVFPRRPEWSVGNYWAPEIWQENGKIYIFYTARKKTDRCASPSLLPINQPDLIRIMARSNVKKSARLTLSRFATRTANFFSRGKKTATASVNRRRSGRRNSIRVAGGLSGKRQEIMRNDPETWEGNLVEGQFIMRKDGWFYMFYAANACCGRGCNYAMGVARSKTLLGKWEKYNENPILKGNENFNCPGHGSVVTLENGRTFMMYHAYDPKDTNYVGRQALLDEVNWTADGWATINNGRGASKQAPAPLGVAERDEEYRFFDDFTSPTLRFGLQWQQNNVPNYSLSNGFLNLAPGSRDQMKNPLGAIMAYYTTVGSYAATTQIDVDSIKNGAIAGISAYGDNENALGFGVQNGKIVVWRRERNNHRTLSTAPAPAGKQIYLRMNARDGIFYNFAFSTDGRNFKSVGMEQNGDYLPPWDRGVRVALTVGAAENASARFGFLRIEPTRGK
jgi:beta-xylosidase